MIFSALAFNYALECANRKLQENPESLESYGALQLLVNADDFNVLRENVNTVKIYTHSNKPARRLV
jgi:hypothetical protein